MTRELGVLTAGSRVEPFAAMNEVQELVASRLGWKTKVVFASPPG